MKFSIRQICMISIMTAIIAAVSILTIPTPWGVPFTLQTFAVALSGYLLGKRDGTIAVFLYLLLGTIGVPVFAQMSSGVGVIVGPSGGYLIGFVGMAFLCGVGKDLNRGKIGMVYSGILGILGLAVCHLIGALRLMSVAHLSVKMAFVYGSLPYLLKDVISVVGALAMSMILQRALQAAHLFDNMEAKESV
ncbi:MULTISPECIES: biotin transporter BioY [Agathobacter]|uniref:Biotin transporter n=1 Tax=Agathobacter ruminis TaxID=1712665 RepID=A0A2G3E2M7_9FIRM|nr:MULTISPECIES: biotin transporter BioY [Agathobacter]MBQ1681926.1 biotin transporter BioY [Agathobacter sp.]MDC7300801.1 biotin transporter BioY [Agathobacter ruminis]PHU37514.1 biotin transporter BioY [Agathobacter ruminis]